MKLYIDIREMTFIEDNIEREIITKVENIEYLRYDYMIELSDNDIFIEDTFDKNNNVFHIREESTWWSFPLYQIINDKIVPFDCMQYQYFADTNRRMALAKKIGGLYNPSSESKILRTTMKRLLDNLEVVDEKFEKYNTKIEKIIRQNPKEMK